MINDEKYIVDIDEDGDIKQLILRDEIKIENATKELEELLNETLGPECLLDLCKPVNKSKMREELLEIIRKEFRSLNLKKEDTAKLIVEVAIRYEEAFLKIERELMNVKGLLMGQDLINKVWQGRNLEAEIAVLRSAKLEKDENIKLIKTQQDVNKKKIQEMNANIGLINANSGLSSAKATEAMAHSLLLKEQVVLTTEEAKLTASKVNLVDSQQKTEEERAVLIEAQAKFENGKVQDLKDRLILDEKSVALGYAKIEGDIISSAVIAGASVAEVDSMMEKYGDKYSEKTN